MRIVVPMLSYYRDQPSGSTRLAFDEAVYLATHGHDVWVVTQDQARNKPEHTHDYEHGFHILRYPSPSHATFDPRRAGIHQRLTRQLLRRYIGDDVDVVHGHSLLQYAGAVSACNGNTRTCYSVHSPVKLEMAASARGASISQRLKFSISGRLAHRLEAQCLCRSDGATSDSEFTRDRLATLHSSKVAERVQVVPGWVDLSRFQVRADREALKRHLGWPTEIPTLFTLRRLVPRMGLDRLIGALHSVKSMGRRCQLVIGGSGPLRGELEKQTEDLGLTDSVSFAGYIPDAQLPWHYAAADAFVLPTSELECFGLIALEALACGTPVLATPVAAIPEILQKVEPGWLAEDASTEAIARLLVDFLHGKLPRHDPEKLREIIDADYAAERVIPRLVDVAIGAQPTHENSAS